MSEPTKDYMDPITTTTPSQVYTQLTTLHQPSTTTQGGVGQLPLHPKQLYDLQQVAADRYQQELERHRLDPLRAAVKHAKELHALMTAFRDELKAMIREVLDERDATK